jgi:ADP-ribose pyrophosphatase
MNDAHRDALAEPVETLAEGRFLRLQKRGTWEYVTRIKANGAAFICAITDARAIVLVEQLRVPVGVNVIELPAGIIGDEVAFEHETFEAAASRELEEETGFRAGHIEKILTGPTAPGMSSEMLHLFRATQLVRVSDGGGVEGENITVHVVPLDRVSPWLKAQAAAGKLIEPRVYTGLWFAHHD